MSKTIETLIHPLARLAITGSLACLGITACTEATSNKSDSLPAEAEELVANSAKAKAIFVGRVVAIDERLSDPDANGRVVPFRFVTWQVEQAVRGVDGAATWTGRFVGGPYGDGRTLSASEVPDFEVGQRALLLANDGDAGTCALIGCRHGMLLLGDDRTEELDGATVQRVIDAMPKASIAVRARSVDPKAHFSFSMPVARSPRASAVVVPRPVVPTPAPTTDAERAELSALANNGRNPVVR